MLLLFAFVYGKPASVKVPDGDEVEETKHVAVNVILLPSRIYVAPAVPNVILPEVVVNEGVNVPR